MAIETAMRTIAGEYHFDEPQEPVPKHVLWRIVVDEGSHITIWVAKARTGSDYQEVVMRVRLGERPETQGFIRVEVLRSVGVHRGAQFVVSGLREMITLSAAHL